MSIYGQEESLRRLQQILTQRIPVDEGTGAGGDRVEGTGRALDDQVTVTVADGKIAQVELGPRAKRADDVTLAEAIKDATNAALEDFLTQRSQAVAAPAFDRLLTQLQQVSADASASMERTTRSLDEAMRAVHQQATRPNG